MRPSMTGCRGNPGDSYVAGGALVTVKGMRHRDHAAHAASRSALPVDRPLLDDLLGMTLHRRLGLVTAGAGWGKTTAVGAWADRGRTGWLTVIPDDADAVRLARRVCEVLGPVVAGQPPAHVVEPDPDAGRLGGKPVLDAVCGWLREVAPTDLVLVLDDVHQLPAGGAAADFLHGLCQQAPEQLHLVLVTRGDPPFPVERLRGQGLLAEVDASNLGFDVTEIEAVLRVTVDERAGELASHVAERTGGWPVAVKLAADAMRGVDPEQRRHVVDSLSQPGGRLGNYLAEEVLDGEAAQVQELLRHLAVLGETSASVAFELGFGDATCLLPNLARRGLVQGTPGPEEAWRLLPPLAGFIRAELSVSATDRRMELDRRAAELFARRGAYAKALRHLLAASEHEAAAALLIEHGATLVETGGVSAVLAAAELPARYLEDPRIQQLLGYARQVQGRWASALDHFHRTASGRDELEPGLAWRMGLGCQSRGEYESALEVYRRARPGRQDTADEARLLAWAASAYRMIGDYEHGRELATSAVAAARQCGDRGAQAAAHIALGMLAAAAGDPRVADANLLVALDAAAGGDDRLELARARTIRAMHLIRLGQPRVALQEVEVVLLLSEQCEHRLGCALARLHRGDAKALLGRLDEALADLTASHDQLQEMGSLLAAWPLVGIGHVHRLRGQLAQARADYEAAIAALESSHDVVAMSAALAGLARTRAADDIAVARDLAERAVGLGEGLCHVQALLARGWVALCAADREMAAADADRAAQLARRRCDHPGLAEALELAVLASHQPAEASGSLAEAIEIWRGAGYPIQEAQARLVVAATAGSRAGGADDLAERALAAHGIGLDTGHAAGPLAVLGASAPSVSIRTLGSFQVLRGGEPIPTTAWQSRKARDLLKILVARRRPVGREQLIELLWPDQEPGKAGSRLSVLLSTVRTVLGCDRDGEDGGPLCTVTSGRSRSAAARMGSVGDRSATTSMPSSPDSRAANAPRTIFISMTSNTRIGTGGSDSPAAVSWRCRRCCLRCRESSASWSPGEFAPEGWAPDSLPATTAKRMDADPFPATRTCCRR
jgi:ATP/maltotriose-dependent transcriptional regulator MalT